MTIAGGEIKVPLEHVFILERKLAALGSRKEGFARLFKAGN